jgi:chromosome segregation ATPase
MVPVDELWRNYARASVAFDLMAPNPEREINLSFRQIDYLRCGLPIITAPRQVIADDLLEYGAGWTIEPGDVEGLRHLVKRLLHEPELVAEAASAAQRLAADKFVWTRAVASLGEYLTAPTRRRNSDTFVARMSRTQADLWEDHEENKRIREVLGHQHDDLTKKTAEIDRLNGRIQTLLGTVDRLTDSIGDVSKFKSDALNYLGESQDAAIREAGELGRELERKALDLYKKHEALQRTHKEVEKLKLSVEELRLDNEALETRYVDRDADVMRLESEHRVLSDSVSILNSNLSTARHEVGLKEQTIGELARNLNELEARFLEKLDQAESNARELITSAQARTVRAESARGKSAEQVHHLEERADTLSIDLVKKEEELQTAEQRRNRDVEELHARLEQAVARSAELLPERDQLRGRLSEAEADAAAARADVIKKNRALTAADRERERLGQEFLAKLDRAEALAREVIEESRDRTALLAADRGKVRARLDETDARLRDAERQLRGTHSELMERNRAAEEAYATWERDRRTIQEGADESVRLARAEADTARLERDAKHTALLDARSIADSAQEEVKKKEEDLVEAKTAQDALKDEMETRLASNWSNAKRSIVLARSKAEAVRDQLVGAEARLKDIEADNRKKDQALAEAEREREHLSRKAVEQLDVSEQTARGLIEEARDRALEIDAERGRLKASVAELQQELREARRSGAVTDDALAQTRADRAEKVRALELQNKESWLIANRQIDHAHSERDRVGAKLLTVQEQVTQLESEILERDAALLEGESALAQLEVRNQEAWLSATRQIDHARGDRDSAATKLVIVQNAVAEREAEIEQLRSALQEAESSTSEAELESREAWLRANQQLEQVQVDFDRASSQLLEKEFQANDLEADVLKKNGFLREAAVERQRLEEEYIRRLEEAEAHARSRIDTFREHFEARVSTLRMRYERAEQDAAIRSEAEKLRITDEAEERITGAREQADSVRTQRDRARAELALVVALVEDLEVDVEKKTAAIAQAQLERDRLQEEFLANLESAEGSAQTLIEAARGRAAKLSDERTKLTTFVADLEVRAHSLDRELESRDAALQLADQRVRAERGNFEEVLLELNKLRQSSTESRGRGAELEAELIRQQSALESLSGELARSGAALEMISFDAETLRGEGEKKTSELRAAQTQRDETQRLLEETREHYEADLAGARAESGRAAARLEEVEFELRTLRAEVAKKSAELQEAQRQRDEAHTLLGPRAPSSGGSKKPKKRPEA